MKNDRKNGIKLRLPSKTDYDVGYGKPPKDSQFKAGHSGNPSGRPKGSRSKVHAPPRDEINDLIMLEANRKIRVQEGGRTRTLTVARAVLRALNVAALKGSSRAQQTSLQIYRLAETEQQQQRLQHFMSWCTYKFDWEDKLELRRQQGIIAPDPIPHPDQITLDPRRGIASIKGPITVEEKVKLDECRKQILILSEAITALEADLAGDINPKYRVDTENELEYCKKLRSKISKFIED